MKIFPSSKYVLIPITDEQTYLKYCDWVEELDDIAFGNEAEEDKKFAYLDAMTTLIQAYEAKNFVFNKLELRQLTLTQIRKLHKELRIPTDILVGV